MIFPEYPTGQDMFYIVALSYQPYTTTHFTLVYSQIWWYSTHLLYFYVSVAMKTLI